MNNSLSELTFRQQGGRSKASLQLILDLKCNNNCTICGGSWPYQPQLSTKEAIDRLHHGMALGIEEVVLSGGEVTLRHDLLTIVRAAKQIGYQTIVVLTNGRRLSDSNLVRALIESGVGRFGTSLYGATAEIHESVTRKTDSFSQTITGIKTVVRYMPLVSLSVNCVVTPTNYPTLRETVEKILALGARTIQITYIVPVGKSQGVFYDPRMPSMSETIPSIREAVQVFRSRCQGMSGCSITLSFYPFCLLGDLVPLSSEAEEKYTYFASEKGELVPIDFELNRQQLRTKCISCGRCIFDSRCNGIWREYVQARGWSEFTPVTV